MENTDYIGGIVSGEVRGHPVPAGKVKFYMHGDYPGLFSGQNHTNWRYFSYAKKVQWNLDPDEESKRLVDDWLSKRGITGVRHTTMYKNLNENSKQTVRIYNKTLEPNLWDKEQNLKPEVRIDLLKIAKDFYKSTDFKSEIIDILLLGSSINYNWTPESDIDVHIVIDITKEGLDTEHFRKFLDALGSKFNKEHDISIFGHPVEVYIQDITEKNSTVEKARKHASMFSLLNNKWLIPPKHEDITLDKETIRKSYHEIKSKIDKVINDNDFSALKDIMKYIRDYRNKGLEGDKGEFSTENIVFKALRHTGVLEKMKNAINSIYDRMVSIQEHREYIDNLVYVDSRIFDNILEETVVGMETGVENFILVGAVDADLHVDSIKQSKKEIKFKTPHAIHKMLYATNHDLDPITGIDWRYRSDTNELMWWDWPSEEMSDAVKKYLKKEYGIDKPKYVNIRNIDIKKRHSFHDLDYYYKHVPVTDLEEDILFETAYNTIIEENKNLQNFIVTGRVSKDLDVNGELYTAKDPIITHAMITKKYGNSSDYVDWRYRADENMVYFLDKEPSEQQKDVIFDFLKSRFGVINRPSYVYLQRWNAYIYNKSHKPGYASNNEGINLHEILDKTSNLFLGWVNRTDLDVLGIGIRSGDDTETHHNYLLSLPDKWKGQSDRNIARWRYRKDLNTVYWWEFNIPTEEEKGAVSRWVKQNLNKENSQHRIIPIDLKTYTRSREFRDSHGD